MKTRLPQGLFSYMELLKNMFSTVLGMKNSNKVKKKFEKKVRKTAHCDISVAAICRRDKRH